MGKFSIALGLGLFLIGMVAISAMFLPEISGSTLLLIFGAYIPVITAVKAVLSIDFSYIPSLIFFGCRHRLSFGSKNSCGTEKGGHNPLNLTRIITEEGMYLFDDLDYIEFVNGQMYLTCFYNEVQPIIRYRLSDQLKFRENSPHQRYVFRRVEIVNGRDEDVLWFQDRDGNREFLHPLCGENHSGPTHRQKESDCQAAGEIGMLMILFSGVLIVRNLL